MHAAAAHAKGVRGEFLFIFYGFGNGADSKSQEPMNGVSFISKSWSIRFGAVQMTSQHSSSSVLAPSAADSPGTI